MQNASTYKLCNFYNECVKFRYFATCNLQHLVQLPLKTKEREKILKKIKLWWNGSSGTSLVYIYVCVYIMHFTHMHIHNDNNLHGRVLNCMWVRIGKCRCGELRESMAVANNYQQHATCHFHQTPNITQTNVT
ncbi:unnamed protein product [Ceratitis capitata]|uniref:(Mediterranean fruit fly) hypothetical protein n=1 Tax=Ceratitis capitata TaxID=7213 RepID=A0A811V9B8_CERCA|nr:unnamed protein product [Ceratitis capitata]